MLGLKKAPLAEHPGIIFRGGETGRRLWMPSSWRDEEPPNVDLAEMAEVTYKTCIVCDNFACSSVA